MFPRDTKTVFFDNPNNNTQLLATSTIPRTFLYGRLDCESSTGDIHLRVNGGTFYYMDRESAGTLNMEVFTQYATNSPIYYTESVARNCFVTLSYVERDRSITPDPVRDNVMTFQESLFVSCVIIAIISLTMWRFIFRSPQEI